jgi:hypothetical protein
MIFELLICEGIMQIKINVRSASRKKASILQRSCEYPDRAMTVEEFIAETVRQNVREYNDRKDAVELLRLFSREQSREPIEEQLEDMAASGKVSYGEPMDDRKADPEAAVKNAVQCFEDGMVALFADGVRYTKKDEPIPLKDQSEVTFVRLVFLAGRMW